MRLGGTQERLATAGQWECFSDSDLELTFVDQVSDGRELAAVRLHDEKCCGDAQLSGSLLRWRCLQGDQPAARAKYRKGPVEGGAPHRVDHDVVDGGCHIEQLILEVDDGVRAVTADGICVLRPRGGYDVSAQPAGQLDDEPAHPAGTAVDQHRFP